LGSGFSTGSLAAKNRTTQNGMKKTQLVFLLFVGLAIAVGPLAFEHIKLNEGMVLSRADFWRLGFAPLMLALGVTLGVAAVWAYRGSTVAFQLCASWAAIYSAAVGGLAMWYFPEGVAEVAWVMLAWSAGWYLWIRRWKFSHGV
jgi:hypothetical protein